MRPTVLIHPIDRPGRVTTMFYPRPDHRAPPETPVVNHHNCAPGLRAAVRRGILAETGESPGQEMRRRAMVVDPGGGCSAVAPFLRVGITACGTPWYLDVGSDLVHGAIRLMRAAQPHDYGGAQTMRFMTFTCLCVVRPQELAQAIDLLQPHEERSIEMTIDRLSRLATIPQVCVAGLMPPAADGAEQ